MANLPGGPFAIRELRVTGRAVLLPPALLFGQLPVRARLRHPRILRGRIIIPKRALCVRFNYNSRSGNGGGEPDYVEY